MKTKAELDYETKTSYMVEVTVTDGFDAEGNVDAEVDDTIMVTITVMDVNEAPEFAAKTATREVAENTVADTNIGAPVTAMDEDSGDTLMYAFDPESADDDSASFAIVPTTGQLKTLAPLDYETKTDYEVRIIAMDDDDTPLPSDPITVTINVRNVSAGDTPVDNSAPRFNDGPSTTREVAENTEKDENIGAPVAATDPGDTLTYALDETARDDFDSFDIDSTTGQLKTKAGTVLHFEEVQGITLKTSYEVTVTVTDGKDAENNVVMPRMPLRTQSRSLSRSRT